MRKHFKNGSIGGVSAGTLTLIADHYFDTAAAHANTMQHLCPMCFTAMAAGAIFMVMIGGLGKSASEGESNARNMGLSKGEEN